MKNGHWLVAALLVGLAGAVSAQEGVNMPFGAPEFGFEVTRVVPSFSLGGGMVTLKDVTPPNMKVMESYARDVTKPLQTRLNAVSAIATASQNDGAVARLERIAAKLPRKSSSQDSMQVTAAAISGLGESTLPRAKKALTAIKTGNGTVMEKHAASSALEKLAQKEEDEQQQGYW